MPLPNAFQPSLVHHSSTHEGTPTDTVISPPCLLIGDARYEMSDPTKVSTWSTSDITKSCIVGCPHGCTYLDLHTVFATGSPPTACTVNAFGFVPFDTASLYGSWPCTSNAGASVVLAPDDLKTYADSSKGVWIPLFNENDRDLDISVPVDEAVQLADGNSISSPYTIHTKGVTKVIVVCKTATSEVCSVVGFFGK